MSELDFSGKTVLVVGGSSGIGNGIAHGFLSRGAHVHVWGTRASADDYEAADGSDLSGLHYSCVDVADHAAIEAHQADFDTLDVLVLSQGVVRYQQEEFEKPGWDYVMDVNIDSVMAAPASSNRFWLKAMAPSLLSAPFPACRPISAIRPMRRQRRPPSA